MKEQHKLTHKQLVEIGYRWLLKNGHVGVCFKELKSMDGEIPDVIAFSHLESLLIECKISRLDFLQDKKKLHRQKGMGNWRFYMCPTGMIKKEELPAKWGLIYVSEKGKAKIEYDCRIKEIPCEPYTIGGHFGVPEKTYTSRIICADENRFEADSEAERAIMYTALRRLFIKGYINTIYDKQYNRLRPSQIIKLNETVYEKEKDQNAMSV